MDVDRMRPAAAAALEMPDLNAAEIRSRRNEARVRAHALAAVGLDRPRGAVRSGAATELEAAVPRICEFFLGEGGQGEHLLRTLDVVGGIHAQVLALVGLHPKLEELADRRISVVLA